MSCVKAERKKSSQRNKPGLIIASFSSHEDKRKVMISKRSLLTSRIYQNVYINHDQTHADRVMSNNFCAVLGSLKHNGLSMKGTRVVRRDDNRQGNNGGICDPDRRSPQRLERDSRSSNRDLGNIGGWRQPAAHRDSNRSGNGGGWGGRYRGVNRRH